jgi:hypothetical protein
VGLLLLPPAEAQDSAASVRPASRQIQIITNGRTAATSSQQAPVQLQNVSNPAAAEDLARKSAEIVVLQKQIKEKQKHIELLMRLFVTDEQRFAQTPADAEPDPAAQVRVRQEQEELRAESAACARLQARLLALSAATSRP